MDRGVWWAMTIHGGCKRVGYNLVNNNNKEREEKDFPYGPVVKSLCFHCQGSEWVQSLVGELRSLMPHALPKHKTKKRI